MHFIEDKSFNKCLKEAKEKPVDQQLKDLYGKEKASEIFKKMNRGN